MDGEELMHYLRREGRFADPDDSSRPDLILLDLNMPKMGGEEALEAIRSDPELKRIPVVVLSTSLEPGDVHRSYNLGANSYITKPESFEGLTAVMKALASYWSEIVTVSTA